MCVGVVGLFLSIHVGATEKLLNVDNEEINFKVMPIYNGMLLHILRSLIG